MRLEIKSRTDKILLIASLIGLFLVIISLQPRYKISIVYDTSVNMSLALLDEYKKEGFKQGEYIGLVYKADHEVYKINGLRMLKKVVCLPGQWLHNNGYDFYCDGEFISKAKPYDIKGNPTVLFNYNGLIPDGKYFVVGENKDSFDSKYYGFIDKTYILGKIYKIF